MHGQVILNRISILVMYRSAYNDTLHRI